MGGGDGGGRRGRCRRRKSVDQLQSVLPVIREDNILPLGKDRINI